MIADPGVEVDRWQMTGGHAAVGNGGGSHHPRLGGSTYGHECWGGACGPRDGRDGIRRPGVREGVANRPVVGEGAGEVIKEVRRISLSDKHQMPAQ